MLTEATLGGVRPIGFRWGADSGLYRCMRRCASIERRNLDRKEIFERLIFPMINEGARILDEGIAMRPGDIDVIWVYGYGWPVWTGGPMHYADRVGLPYIRGRLAEIAARAGNRKLEPAPLLPKLAQRGGTFAGFKKAAQ